MKEKREERRGRAKKEKKIEGRRRGGENFTFTELKSIGGCQEVARHNSYLGLSRPS